MEDVTPTADGGYISSESPEEPEKKCWKCLLFGEMSLGFLGVLIGLGTAAIGIDLMTNGRFLRMFGSGSGLIASAPDSVWEQKAKEAMEDEDIDEADITD